MSRFRVPSALALLALPLALGACGQTPSAAQMGTPVTAQALTVEGTVSALSSDHTHLTVAGQTFAITGAAFAQGVRAASASTVVTVNGGAANAKALSVGQHVTAHVEDGVATDVDVDVKARGPIGTLDFIKHTVEVAGQAFAVNADTRIELDSSEDGAATTAHTMADLALGDFAEVTGEAQADGTVLASNIEVKSDQDLRDEGKADRTHAEVKGNVAALDAQAKTFMLSKLSVDYAGANVHGTLSANAQVHVEGVRDPQKFYLLHAKNVQVRGNQGGEAGEHRGAASIVLESRARQLDAGAKTFVLGEYTVDFSKAEVRGTLGEDARVNVKGMLDAQDAKLVHAARIDVGGEHERN